MDAIAWKLLFSRQATRQGALTQISKRLDLTPLAKQIKHAMRVAGRCGVERWWSGEFDEEADALKGNPSGDQRRNRSQLNSTEGHTENSEGHRQ